jgi:hypothetical protein
MIEQGSEPPIYCVTVASNGSIIACHYVEDDGPGLNCRMVAEHIEDRGLKTPINVFFSDSSGRAAKVRVETAFG